jgi:hypothetical protein
VFVWVDATQDTTQDAAEDAYQDAASRVELVDELRDQVRFLREELARKDAILLRMAESIPQLEAPTQEPPGAPETATAQPGRGEPQPAVEGAMAESSGRPQGAVRGRARSWWKRYFGASMVGLVTALGVLHASGEQMPFPTAPEPRSAQEQATATKSLARIEQGVAHAPSQASPPISAPEPAPAPEAAPAPEPVAPEPVTEQPPPVPAPTD